MSDMNDFFSSKPIGEGESDIAEDTLPQDEGTEQQEEEENLPSGDQEGEELDHEESSQEDSDGTLVTLEIGGKEYNLAAEDVQNLATQYVDAKKQLLSFEKDRKVVTKALEYLDNIKTGKNLDESFGALGVDIDALAKARVKEMLRQSAMSETERERERMIKENERLRKEKEERDNELMSIREKKEFDDGMAFIEKATIDAINSIPQEARKEVAIVVTAAVSKRIRQSGELPSASSIQNAVKRVYQQKFGQKAPETKVKPTRLKNDTPGLTSKKKDKYDGGDYTDLWR